MPIIKATIEYDGTDFYGFQKQPSQRTVQTELEWALGKVFRESTVKIIGSGRTDAGVHATGQVVSFQAPEGFPVDRILPAVNGRLSNDVRVKRIEVPPEGFHPRYSAKTRTYIYVVLNRPDRSVFLSRYAWHIILPLDLESMRKASSELIGCRDFASFGRVDIAGASTVRRIFNIQIRRKKDAVFFVVKGNAFLRGMVRAMVGTLVEVGQGKRSPAGVAELLDARNRQAVRQVAPSQGLYLTSVEY